MGSLRPLAIKLALCCLAIFLTVTNSAYAETQEHILQARGAQSSEAFSKHMDFYLDPHGMLSIDDILEVDHKFERLKTSTPRFGFTKNAIWLRTTVHNKTPDVDTWYIHVHENFLPNYRVYLQRSNGELEVLELHSPFTNFSNRTIAFPEIATALTIASEEQVTLYVTYTSGGSSNIAISLETESSFTKNSMKKTSKNFISYGMMLIVIATSFLSFVILKRRVFLSYLLYVIVILLFLMHSDGVTFQYFWPNAPQFNNYFSIIIGLAFSIVPYDFARVFLRTKTFHPNWDKFMIFMMIATPIIMIPAAFIDAQYSKGVLMLLASLSILTGAFVGILAAFKRFKEVRFYVLAWVVGTGSAAVMSLRHFTDSAIGQQIELDSIRIAIVVDAIMMGLGVADRYSQQLKERRKADMESLNHARQNLQLNDRLHVLEEQYRLATELVQTRDIELKNTIHDLRQPLHALRLNVQKLRARSEDIDARDVDTTFTYLENLISRHLKSSVGSVSSLKGGDISENKALNLSAILNSIHEMFLPDATAKGLNFRFVDTRHDCDVEPIVLMRIITNIVSNAIKYTSSGKILMGVRSLPDGLRIEVHDTGPGLSAEEFSRVKARYVRLANKPGNNEGQGLGLNIANDLALKNGLDLFVLSGKRNGTSMILKIPKMGYSPDRQKPLSPTSFLD